MGLSPQASSHFPSCGESTRISCTRGSTETTIAERHMTTSSIGLRRRRSGSGPIRVGVRVRPVFRHEAKFWTGRSGEYWPSVRARGENIRGLVEQDSCDRRGGGARNRVDVRMLDGWERSFGFDCAFDPGCGQRKVYERYLLGIFIRRRICL